MPWKIVENIIAGQVSATPKQDPGVSRYTKPMPRNGLESINSGASSCRYKYPRELRLIFRHVSSPARIQRKRDPVSRVPDRFHLSDISLSEDTGITPPALRSHLPLQPELLPWAAPHRRPSFRPIPTRQSQICRFCPAYRRWNSGSCTFLSEASSLQW